MFNGNDDFNSFGKNTFRMIDDDEETLDYKKLTKDSLKREFGVRKAYGFQIFKGVINNQINKLDWLRFVWVKLKQCRHTNHLQSQQPFGSLDNTILQDEEEQSIQQVKDIPNRLLKQQQQQQQQQLYQQDSPRMKSTSIQQLVTQPQIESSSPFARESEYISRLEELDEREKSLNIQEKELIAKIEYYNDLINRARQKESDLNIKFSELQLAPISYLHDNNKLKEKIKQMKQNYIQEYALSFQPNKELDSLHNIRIENDEFTKLFSNANNMTELRSKCEFLKNFELRLVEERIKIEIIESYLRKEIDAVKQNSEQLDEEIMRYRVLNQFEKALQEESRLLDQKKLQFQQQRQLFYQDIIQNNDSNGFKNEFIEVQKQIFDNNLRDSAQYLERQSQISGKQSELESLKISLERDAQDAITQKHQVEIQKRKIQEQNEELIQQLISENRELRDQLHYEKNNITIARQRSLSQNVSHVYDEETEVLKQTRDMKRQNILIPIKQFIERWVQIYMKRSRGVKVAKGACFNLWKIKTLTSDMHRKIHFAETGDKNPAFFDFKWDQTKQKLIIDRRYPLKSLVKQRREFELTLFDLERRKFFKDRFVALFGSILRRQRRRERLLKVIGFHTFIRKVALLTRVPIPRQMTQPSSFVDDLSFLSRATQQQQKIGDFNFKPANNKVPVNKQQQPKKLNQSQEFSKKADKSPIKKPDKKQSKSQSLSTENFMENEYQKMLTQFGNRVQKLQGIVQIVSFHQRKEVQRGQQVAISFSKWLRFSVEWENKALQEELASINFILNERVFRENLLRTKLRLSKSETDSKITLINELMSAILSNSK